MSDPTVEPRYQAPNIGVPNILNLRGLRFVAAGDGGEVGVAGQVEQPNDGGDKSGYTPPATQQDLNRIIAERVNRAKAPFADYEDLKGKAARLTEIEQANLSEAEKTAQRIAAAESEVAKVPAKVAEALRDSLITLGVVPEDRKVLLTASDPETLLAQVKAIQGLDADRKKTGNRSPREGLATTTAGSGSDDERAFVRNLFGSE